MHRRDLRIAFLLAAAALGAFGGIAPYAGDLTPGEPPRAPIGAAIADPASGEIWVGTLGAGLLRWSEGRIDRFTQFNSGLAGDEILSVAWFGGRVFCATGNGVSAFDPRADVWTLYFERRLDAPHTLIVQLATVPPATTAEPALHARSSRGDFLRYDAERDAWDVVPPPPAWATAVAAASGGAGPFAPGRLLDGSPAYDGATAVERARPVGIGLLSPTARLIALAGGGNPVQESYVDRLGVDRAIASGNAGRGPTEPPRYALSPATFEFERYGWGTPEDNLAILALRPSVAGAVGRLGSGPRIEPWLAARLEFPVVDASADGPADDGPDETWVFGCNRYGHASQDAVLDRVLAEHRRPRLAIVRTPEPAAAERLTYWARRAEDRGAPIRLDAAWNPALEDPGPLVARLRGARIDAVLTWTDAAASTTLLRALRAAGSRATFVGGDAIVDEEFARSVPAGKGEVFAAVPCRHAIAEPPQDPGTPVDPAFEAAAHLLTAIDAAGPDRAAVRAELLRMPGRAVAVWETGTWRWFALPRPAAPPSRRASAR